MIQVMGRILSGFGQLRFATNGTAALRLAQDVPPDLMLLDAEMAGMSGYQVCEAMKADPALRDVPTSPRSMRSPKWPRGAASTIRWRASGNEVCALASAEHLAHRVLDDIEALAMPHETSPIANHVTVSISIAHYDRDSACWVEPSPDSRFCQHPAMGRERPGSRRRPGAVLCQGRWPNSGLVAGHRRCRRPDAGSRGCSLEP